MTAARHIVILCSRLDLPGGIERAVVNTANLFISKNNTVTLLILDETDRSFYPIDSSVTILRQPLSFGITKEGNVISRKLRMLSDVLKLRKRLRLLKADIVISSEYPFTVAMVLAGAKKYSRIFSWEHHHYAWLEKNKFWTTLFQYTCPRLDGIICLNKEEKVYYEKFAPVKVIPNHIENKSSAKTEQQNRRLLTIGRLIPRKGIDLLLPVAKKILAKHPEWTWKIIGDGEMKQQVLDYIQQEKLEGKLLLQPPAGNDLCKEYGGASVFILTSRSEAFPMVLLEAMSHGLPCISFNCPSGPADIITDKEDGLLVEKENTTALFEAIDSLLTDERVRKQMGKKAFSNIQRYSPENVYTLWKSILQ